jgi:hypothetical protein
MENPGQGNDQAAQAEKQRQQEQARRNILEQILTPEARERCTEMCFISLPYQFVRSVSDIYSETRKGKIVRELDNWCRSEWPDPI